MRKTSIDNILIIFTFIICICLLSLTQSSNTQDGTLKTLIVKEYNLKNKKINNSDITNFVKNYETNPLSDLVYITKELPDNFTFESPFFDERDYTLFKKVLEPIGYKISINHRIEAGGFYKKKQSYYVIEISK